MLSFFTPVLTLKLTLLILPGFSLLSLGTFIERLTNSFSGHEGNNRYNYSIMIVTLEGECVISSCGVRVAPDGTAFDQGMTPVACSYFAIFGGKDLNNMRDIPTGLDILLNELLNKDIQIICMDSAVFFLSEMDFIKKNILINSKISKGFMSDSPLLTTGNVNNIISDNIWYYTGNEAAATAADHILHRNNEFLCYIQLQIDEMVNELPKNKSRYQPENPAIRSELGLVLTFLIRNISSGSDLDELALRCGFSKKKLERLLLTRTGRTLPQIISDLRIMTACAMLKDEKKSLHEIAGKCGFSSTAHFSRFFKSKTCLTPGQWQYEYFTAK